VSFPTQIAFEDELYRRHADGEALRALAEQTALGKDAVRTLIEHAADRERVHLATAGGYERSRHTRRPTEIVETFEQARKRRMGNHPRTATDPSIALDEAVDRAGHPDGLRECPICRRRFRPSRVDQLVCRAKCRDLLRRLRARDKTVLAGLRMLLDPPPCADCGKPLWDMRPDARFHGHRCRKRHQRRTVGAMQTPSASPNGDKPGARLDLELALREGAKLAQACRCPRPTPAQSLDGETIETGCTKCGRSLGDLSVAA
jgi:hypothetical protein